MAKTTSVTPGEQLEALRLEIQKGLDSGISNRTPKQIFADVKRRKGLKV